MIQKIKNSITEINCHSYGFVE